MGTAGALGALGLKVGSAALLALGAAASARGLCQARLPGWNGWSGRARFRARERSLRVIEAVSVGPQRALLLVAIGRPDRVARLLLIASTPSQITLLETLSADLLPPPEQTTSERACGADFAALLRSLVGARREPRYSLPEALRRAAQALRQGGGQ